MNAVKLNIKLEPDSLTKNPEIAPFIGKNVELILIEETEFDEKQEIKSKDDSFFQFITNSQNFQNDKENLSKVSEEHDKYIY